MPFRLQRPPPTPPPPSTSTRRTNQRPNHPNAPTLTLTQKLTHLTTPLHPLLNVRTGRPHPSFPPTLLHYHLLTHAQLDDLASYYHQRTPGPCMFAYPYTEGRELCVGNGVPGEGMGTGEGRALGWRRYGMGLEEKRRKFGRFCGLRGCESPGLVGPARGAGAALAGSAGKGMEEGEGWEVEMEVDDGVDAADMEREREVRERMEREWQSAVRRGREEEEWRAKVGERRFW